MSSSIRSESSGGSLRSGAGIALRLLFFIYSGLIASAPYRSLNGVNLVVLISDVLCDHTAFGSSSTHLPFFVKKAFFGTCEDNVIGAFHSPVGLGMID